MAYSVNITITTDELNKFQICRILLFGRNFVRKTEAGTKINIIQMTDAHIMNTIKHIDRQVTKIMSRVKNYKSAGSEMTWTKIMPNLIMEAYHRGLILEKSLESLTCFHVTIHGIKYS